MSSAQSSGFDYLIDFAEGCPEAIRGLIKAKLEKAGFIAEIENKALDSGEEDMFLLLRLVDEEKLLIEAQVQNIKAELVHSEIKHDHPPQVPSKVTYYERWRKFRFAEKDRFKVGFLTPAQRCMLIGVILEKVPLHENDLKPLRAENILPDQDSNTLLEDEKLVPYFTRNGFLDEVITLHDREQQKEVMNKVMKKIDRVPVNEIREYFGDEVAMYFAWMQHYLWLLFIPGTFGLVQLLLSPIYNPDIDKNPAAGLLSLIIPVWAFLFVRLWKRRTEEIDIEWGNYDIQLKEQVRPEFYGKVRANPITDQPELYFSPAERRRKYLESFLIMLPMILIVIAHQVSFLNLNGYVHSDSFLRIEPFAKLAEPGAIFDPMSSYGWMVPTVSQAVITLILNLIFKQIAIYTTERENHRTQYQFETTIIIKRLFFEYLDCFGYLFYIAFYNQSIVDLRKALISLYVMDEMRRVVIEAVLPFVYFTNKEKSAKKKYEKLKKQDGAAFENEEKAEHILRIKKEVELEEYESFDDYMEMVVQFGYVSLFAAAFPSAAFFSILCNLFEIRSDIFKLTFVHRRPQSRRVKDIGIYFQSLELIACLSLITNLLLFTFCSDQIETLFDFSSALGVITSGDVAQEERIIRFMVEFVFSAEHIILISVFAVMKFLGSTPVWVDIFNQRRRFEQEKEAVLRDQAERKKLEERAYSSKDEEKEISGQSAAVSMFSRLTLDSLRNKTFLKENTAEKAREGFFASKEQVNDVLKESFKHVLTSGLRKRNPEKAQLARRGRLHIQQLETLSQVRTRFSKQSD